MAIFNCNKSKINSYKQIKQNMKTIKILMILLLLVTITSCVEKGVTTQKLTGDEQNLPDELKGLKIYSVSTGGGDWIKVAVLNNQINALSYSEGKYSEHVIIVENKDSYDERIIEVEEIISETDDIIVIKKKK